jgi:uncharacterized protein YlxW (UPF0749 family)
LRSLEFAAATGAVTGSGVVVRLGDARPSSGDVARVQDRDLQRAVNIAWSAGAEAIAVNGQRLGPLTAIRQAGDSILVDYRPVTSPYEISAIGDPQRLEAAYSVGSVSSGLRALASALDVGLEVRPSERLALPGTSGDRTVVARPTGGTAPTGSPGP